MRLRGDVINASSEEIKILYAKIFAGEIKQPGTISLRTLDVVKNLTQQDSMNFMAVAPYIVNKSYILCSMKLTSRPPGLNILLENSLAEAGLLISHQLIKVDAHSTATFGNEIFPAVSYNDYAFINFSNDEEFKFTGLSLTTAGKELFSIISRPSLTEEQIKWIADYLSDTSNLFELHGSKKKNLIKVYRFNDDNKFDPSPVYVTTQNEEKD